MSNLIENKIIAVVGGGTGIGAGIASALAQQGGKVTVGGRRPEPLREVADSCDVPHPVQTATVDVGKRESVDHFFKSIVDRDGPVDIMVNCAGINIVDRTMAKMDPDDWDRVMNINASGAYRCMAAVLPAMRERKDGLIINISSVAGKRAIELAGVVYASSKFAMTALGTAVGNEVREDGVRVTSIYPGEVNTPILDKRPVPVPEERRRAILQPEDIASMVVAVCQLPPRAHVPEMVIKPSTQEWV